MDKPKKGKLKITKEQYDRIFGSKIINENKTPFVKGGVNRVEKEFQKRGITNLKESEMDGQFEQEVENLIKFLYRKSDTLSPYWKKNNLSYDDICSNLVAKKIIISKDGIYKFSKSMGSADKARIAFEQELSAMIGNDNKVAKDEIEEDWGDDFSNNPTNQEDPRTTRGVRPNKAVLDVIGSNDEFAIAKGNDGALYAFYYADMGTEPFKDYADLTVTDTYSDGEGGMDYDTDDYFEMNDEVIENYLNDNFAQLKVGEGVGAWESGNYSLVRLDDELRQDLLSMYDKDKNISRVLGGMNEESGRDAMDKLKSVATQAFTPSKTEKSDEERQAIIAKVNAIRAKELASREPIKEAGMVLGKGYTHFAIFKADGKIASGWDYSSLYDKYKKKYDADSITPYYREDMKNDFPDNSITDFKLVTRQTLERNNIDITDTNNWYKSDMNETTSCGSVGGSFTAPLSMGPIKKSMPNVPTVREGMDVASAGTFGYDTPGGLTMDLGKKNPKSKAEKKTQYSGGGFVEFNDCTKLNNKTSSTGCSGGAVDNVVSVKKTSGNINAPSLNERQIYEVIAKKTGKTIEEVKSIIEIKNKKG